MPQAPDASSVPSRPRSRREQKKLATRQAIRRNALDLFLDRGYENVTTEDIAAAAEVSASTFFRHFDTKEAVVLDELRLRGIDLMLIVDEQPAGASAGEVITGALAMWAATRRDGELVEAEFTVLRTTPALMDALTTLVWEWEVKLGIRLAERLGDPIPDLELRLLAAWTMSTVRVVMWEWVLQGRRADPLELTSDALGVLLSLPAASRRPRR